VPVSKLPPSRDADKVIEKIVNSSNRIAVA